MTRDDVRNEYFEWLYHLVCRDRFSSQISFRKLLMHLHNTVFRFSIMRDQNRSEDGVDLRYRFALSQGPFRVGIAMDERCDGSDIYDILDGPCTVLEMMIALANRCEETIMDDPDIGDRTGQWFWGMIINMGLGSMSDDRYDRRYVEYVITRLLDREYEPDGTGGLFTVKDCDRDMRDVEIWYQLCWYLDSIT